MLRASLILAVVGLSACGGSGAAGDMTPPPDMARAPTEHPPLWQMKSAGGAVQAAPEVYTVVWPGSETIGNEVVDFMDWMLHSDYWTGSLKEYGVGAGKSMGLVVLSTPPPASISDVELNQLAQMLVSSGQVPANANTQLAILPPASTIVTSMTMGNGCEVYAGYHQHTQINMVGLAYSINLQCRGEAGEPIDQLTRVLSHETAEAATNPIPGGTYNDNSPGRQEIGDLCNFGAGLSVDVAADAIHPMRRYWLQRLYSGQAALDGAIDPCLPLPWSRPYWSVALDPTLIKLGVAAGTTTVNARLDVFAYGDVGLIKWFASPFDQTTVVMPDHGTAHAGDTIPVTITVDSSQVNAFEIDIDSESEKAGATAWFSYVVVSK